MSSEASVTSGGKSASAGLSAEEMAKRKAERQKRIEQQMRAMEDAMQASRSAMEVMKSDYNDDGGGSVSSLGSGRTASTRGGGVHDEEAPGPLPASNKGTANNTEKFMESKTGGVDSRSVDQAAPRLTATESARKFLWDDDEEHEGEVPVAAKRPGLGAAGSGGGLFSPSSRNLGAAPSSSSKQEDAFDLTINQVFGAGEDFSSSTSTPAAKGNSLLGRLTLRLAPSNWGVGEVGHESMKPVNLAPRGGGADNLRDIQAADTDYDNEKGHGHRLISRVGTAGSATKECCVDHRRLVGVVAVAAVVICSVLLVGQNGGLGPTESGRGVGLPSMPSFGFNKGGGSDSKRLKALKSAIIDAQISLAEVFKDADSPQSRSLDWIANHDEAQLELSDPFILQRYALMVLWFGTGYAPVEKKKKKGNFPKPEEDEENVVLEEIWDDSDGWLTAKGFCSWYG